MSDTFPRQYARTRRFTLGAPRSFQVSPDGDRIAFLRSRGGSDPVTCLWVLDVATGQERLVADPAQIGVSGGELDPGEKARRERSREMASGIVGFATDADMRMATFALSGRVYLADMTGGRADPSGAADDPAGSKPGDRGEFGGAEAPKVSTIPADREPPVRELPVRAPAADPRPDPSGRLVGYVCEGALRLFDLASSADRPAAAPGAGEDGVTYGLAEFVAAEEMGRTRGYWWAPDGSALLVARVDDSPVQRWHIADPENPEKPPRQVGYPAAGTANAQVSLLLVRVDGTDPVPVSWDREVFPYLATACWEQPGEAGATPPARPAARAARPAAAPNTAPAHPLIVVQSRDQRQMRLLAVDPGSGSTTVVRADNDPHWLEIVPGVPARTADGRIAWTADTGDARRLLLASAEDLAAGTAAPVTPDGMQVREVLGVDRDTVLFTAWLRDPAEIGLWTYGPRGLRRVMPGGADATGSAGAGTMGSAGAGTMGSAGARAGAGGRQAPATAADVPAGVVASGRAGGGTIVLVSRSLDTDGVTVLVLRNGAEVARVASHAERPLLPVPRPDLIWAGRRALRTAILLPSWHRPGSARLPVLMDPYGGPHALEVLASRSAFLTSQWFAEQGFAVVVADGRGTPGRGPEWERTVAGDLASAPLADQVDALHAAAEHCADLDLRRVAIRGWSFGGYLAALAVLRRPDVFHAAVAGAPVTDLRLYDTHYTERYLGLPSENPEAYQRSSLLPDAAKLSRPLLLIHGLADDNVMVAHTLRLSSALLAAGRQHSVLPLSGVTHMTSQEEVAENLLLLQVDFLRTALEVPGGQGS